MLARCPETMLICIDLIHEIPCGLSHGGLSECIICGISTPCSTIERVLSNSHRLRKSDKENDYGCNENVHFSVSRTDDMQLFTMRFYCVTITSTSNAYGSENSSSTCSSLRTASDDRTQHRHVFFPTVAVHLSFLLLVPALIDVTHTGCMHLPFKLQPTNLVEHSKKHRAPQGHRFSIQA
jgi:hypothetical protein